jgi:hypothetical protein
VDPKSDSSARLEAVVIAYLGHDDGGRNVFYGVAPAPPRKDGVSESAVVPPREPVCLPLGVKPEVRAPWRRA